MGGSLGLMALIALPLAALAQVPINVPLAPSYADCGRITKAHIDRSKALWSDQRHCLSGDIHVGYCDGRNCFGGRATAYRQCCAIDAAVCAEDQTYAAANSLCMSRANAKSAEDEARKALYARQHNDELTQRIRAANNLFDAYSTAREAVESPQKFFTAAVGRDSSLYRELFDSEDHLKNSGLAEELYRYAFNQGRAGIDAQTGVTNPVALAVQSASLDAIKHYSGRAFDQLNGTMEQMMKLDADLAQTLNSFHPQTLSVKSTSPSAGNGPTGSSRTGDSAAGCAILAEPDASRRLLEDHSDQWIALTARCTK
jgi:hypothetical protein